MCIIIWKIPKKNCLHSSRFFCEIVKCKSAIPVKTSEVSVFGTEEKSRAQLLTLYMGTPHRQKLLSKVISLLLVHWAHLPTEWTLCDLEERSRSGLALYLGPNERGLIHSVVPCGPLWMTLYAPFEWSHWRKEKTTVEWILPMNLN